MFHLTSASDTYPPLCGWWISKRYWFVPLPHHESIIPNFNSVLASAPKKVAHILQRVQITARQSDPRNPGNKSVVFHACYRVLRDDLHRLTIPQRLQYKLVVTVHQCLRYTDLQVAAYQSLRFPAANISVRPAVEKLVFRGWVAIRMALRLSQSPFRQFGSYCQNHCVTGRRLVWMLYGRLEMASLCRTSILLAHKSSRNRAIQIDVYLLTFSYSFASVISKLDECFRSLENSLQLVAC